MSYFHREPVRVEQPPAPTGGLQIKVRPTRYVVSMLPDEMSDSDYSDADAWDVTVEWRGPTEKGGDPDRWAVLSNMGRCLSGAGTWDYEPSPSNREDEWKQAHRFPLDKALELAKQAAPHIVVVGMTPQQAYERHKSLTRDEATSVR